MKRFINVFTIIIFSIITLYLTMASFNQGVQIYKGVERIVLKARGEYNDLPYTSKLNIGSSKKLLGKCLFVTIFLSDVESEFEPLCREFNLRRLDECFDFLTKEASRYDREFQPVYKDDNLIFDIKVDFNVPTDFNDHKWVRNLMSAIKNQIDLNGILSLYEVDNVSYIYIVDKPGRSFAMPWYPKAESEIEEMTVIYGRGQTGNLEVSGVYAHEILHLFGAIDLYDFEDERKELVELYLPGDIMNSSRVSDMNVSELDAYLIGWVDELDKKYHIFLEEK